MNTGAQPLTYTRVGQPAVFRIKPQPTDAASALSTTRHRLKLWEISGVFHCSIIGTCLTTSELRRVMAKVASADLAGFNDHALHTDAVNLCGQRNTGSKLLQKSLDQRHQTVIKRFAAARTEAAVMALWDDARRAGDIPGGYWAVLTHPDVGPVGLRQAFGDVHMLSHLVGAANRADIRRLTALEQENAGLLAKVERQQTRLQEAITARDTTIRRLSALAAIQIKAAATPDDDGALADLRHLVADLHSRLASDSSRRERLERRLKDAAEACRTWQREAERAAEDRAGLERELAALNRHFAEPSASPVDRALPSQTVLYVGGRPGSVQQIREALAAAGGVLLSHDGGQHDHASLLPGLISQAERVVFPVDCVSHDAALTVKRVCRQHGKPWLPLRSSGLASFLVALTGTRATATEIEQVA